MAYEVMLGKHVVGTLGPDNKLNYNPDVVQTQLREMFAGQTGGSFFTTAKVVYRWDRNRKTNADAVWNLWKVNPIMQNRITQLNSLTFGRGLKWLYEDQTQMIVDRFWRINRLKSKLNAISTDSQLYGEVFIGLFPQTSGDVLVSIYGANQVDIDFTPGDIYNVNRYFQVFYVIC